MAAQAAFAIACLTAALWLRPWRMLRQDGAVQLLTPLLRLTASGDHAIHEPGDRDHHDHVDRQGGPVLRGADLQRHMGRDEEVVIDEKARDDADQPGSKATRGHPDHDRDHKDERGGGDAEVVAQRQHHRCENGNAC